MAARKRRRSTTRRKSRRAAVSHRPARAPFKRRRRSNPTRRRRVVARGRRRSGSRRGRRNPSVQSMLPLILGAGVSQVVASIIPFGGASLPAQLIKLGASGWLLEKFFGRMAPTVFGQAKEGAILAGGVLVFNQFLAGPIRGAVASVLPRNGNGNGVSGIALTDYPLIPGGMVIPPQMAGRTPVNGIATVRNSLV